MKTRALRWSRGFHAILSLALLFASTSASAVPSLSIDATPGRGIRLSWNQADGAFAPEWTDSLRAPTTWNPVDGFQLLPGGAFSTEMPAATGTRFFRLRSAPLTTIEESSPAHGESGVAVTRETVLRFSQPLATGTALPPDALHAEFGGYRLLSRAELSSDRRSATLFFLENLPGNARVRVTLEAGTLHDIFGRAIDGDDDGQPGGIRIVEFDTSSLASVPKTAVIGRVFASELVPGGAGAGDLNRPLAGVTITVDGLDEALRTTTDAQGNFKLTPVPAGRFFVHVDGRTAVGSEWPGGAYYPFVGKAWEAVAGREDNLAGGNGEIYLPRVPADTLQPVSATADTAISFPSAVLRRNPALAGVAVTVPANALFSENGTRGGKVGIAPVPPDRLPEPLPPGLRFPLVITVQTDGPMNLDRPAPVRFPNLPDPDTGETLPPGAKSALWSFNHDTGLWEIGGSMTVTEDGRFVQSDPGVGIRQPGWHATAPGSQGTGGSANESPCRDNGCSLGPISVFNGPKAQRTFSVPSDHSQGIVNWFVPGASPQGGAGDSFTATFCSAGDHEVRAVLLSNCGQQRCEKVITVSIPDSEAPPQDPCTLLKPLILLTPPPHIAGADPAGAVAWEDPSPNPIGGTICYEFEGADQTNTRCEAGGLIVVAVWCQPGTYRIRRTLTMPCGTQCSMDDGTVTIQAPSPPPACQFEFRKKSLFSFVDTIEEFDADTHGRVGHVEWHLPGAIPETDPQTFDNHFETYLNTVGPTVVSATFTDCTTGQRCTYAIAFEVSPTPPTAPSIATPYSEADPPSTLASAAAPIASMGSKASLASRPSPPPTSRAMVHGVQSFARAPASSENRPLRGLIYYALVDVRNGRVARGLAGSDGILHPLGVQVAPSAPYREHVLQAATLRTGSAEFTSGPNGSRFEMPAIHLDSDSGPDADQDGLSDLGELIMGTDPAKADTDGDGVRDGAEVSAGEDPTSGLNVRTGVVAAAATPGPAVDISAANDVAAVACRDFGLVLFNVFGGLDPVRIAQVETPGEALRVASLGPVAVVADGARGLAIVDLTDPPAARIRHQVNLGAPARCLAVSGGAAFAGDGMGRVHLIDLATGGHLADATLDGPVIDLALLGDFLCAVTPTRLHVLTVQGTLASLGSVDLANGEPPRRLFAADRHAYVVHRNGVGSYEIVGGVPRFLQALVTETITIPDIGWEHLVLNGSGIGLATVSQPTGAAGPEANVWALPAPSGPLTLLQSLDLQGVGRAASIYNGIGYIAADTGGLQVVNYLAQDLGRQAPTLALSASFPLQPASVVEGQPARLTATVGDDVQVRSVAFLIDGVVVATDGNFPFEYRFITPLRSRQTSFILTAVATDTGGNETRIPPISVSITGDTVPPRVVAVSPRDGGSQSTTRTLAVFLDEPAQAGSFAADRWRLREGGPDGQLETDDDVIVTGGSVEDRPDNIAGLLHFPTDLPPGIYRAELLPGVRDLAGNVRGETHAWSFTLTGSRPATGPRMATGQGHTLVIDSDGSLWGWGGNWRGQLGTGGSLQNALRPVRIGTGTDWITVAAAENTTAAIKSDGSLWTWGDGGRSGSVLGQGPGVSRLETPTRVGADNDWRSVIGGNEHFLAIRNDGSLWAWGENEDGTFGLDSEQGASIPVRIGSDLDWMTASTAGEAGTIALKRDGSVWFWDGNSRTHSDVPLRIGTDTDWVDVAGLLSGIEQAEDEFNHVALKSDGSLWYLDLDSRTAQFRFRRLGTRTDWKALYPGGEHLLALDNQGALWAAGRNDDAQLGDGALNDQVDFVRVALSGEVTAVATRFDHSVALTADGTYHTWGGNSSGALGLGFEGTPQPTPLQVGTDTNWVTVEFGMAFAIALKSDGTLWSWGQNFDGQLGVGSQKTHTAPVRVGSESSWTTGSAGNSHVLALRKDGTLWGWGSNGSGRLATDPVTTSRQSLPVQIGSDRDWAQVAAGFEHSFALKTDGSLWAWGGNSAGQLGDGTQLTRLTPTLIGTDPDWRVVVPTGVPGLSTFALRQDGSLWAWGKNGPGFDFPNTDFLGVGDTSSRLTPVRLGTNAFWAGVFAHSASKRLIKTDGTLWSWLGIRGAGPQFRQIDFLAGSPNFDASDLLDIGALAARLVQHAGGVSQYLWDLMDPKLGFFAPEARTTLADPMAPRVEKERVLIQVLATAASQPLLFTPERFADVTLSPRTQALLVLHPSGDSLVELNRRLLEDAHPTELAQFDDRVWVSVGVGDNHILGLRQDGSLWGEGSNSTGELGNGHVDTRSTPLQILSTDRNWLRVEAGPQVSAGIRRDGTLWTWGDYGDGLLGVPSLLQPHAIGNAVNWAISRP